MAIRVLTFFILLTLSVASLADLTPLNDSELSAATGQAFLQLDRSNNSEGLDFTKVTFGLDVETSLNADLVELGNYTRNGSSGADVRIRDFALGSINGDGSINPFRIVDPFIELAFDEDNGKQNVVGVRVGFGGAAGQLSGTIESLTGNINVEIRDTAAGLANADNGLADLTAALLGSSPIETNAVLVDSSGARNNIRATQVGIPNGDTFDIVPDSGLDRFTLSIAAGLGIGGLNCVESGFFSCSRAQIVASGCEAAGIDVCFDLNTYNTLDVGVPQGNGNFGLASGLFVSFQSQSVRWVDDGKTTNTVSGAFINVPNGGLQVNLTQALLGTDRVRTKMLDPYYD